MSRLLTALAALGTAFEQFNLACEQSSLPDYAKPSAMFLLHEPASNRATCRICGNPEPLASVLAQTAREDGNEAFRDSLAEELGYE